MGILFGAEGVKKFTPTEHKYITVLLTEVKRWRGILEVPYNLSKGEQIPPMPYTPPQLS